MSLIQGHFGSQFKNLLVLKVPGQPCWFAVHVPNYDQRWAMYCNDATLIPSENGEMGKVSCVGQELDARCWSIAADKYVSETMVIAELPLAQ